MSDPYFFGYGSLVNANTHVYDETHPATVKGWRRRWRHTKLRNLAYLTVEPHDGGEIDGLIAKVPGADWAALDLRETGYARSRLPSHTLTHGGAPDLPVEIYQTHAHHEAAPSVRHPVLLSYIDTVVQGFLRVYGEDGVQRFFATTAGWDTPILNDRSDPQYPRHQRLSRDETALVDHHLSRLPARVP